MTPRLLALILTVLLPSLTQAATPPAASYLCYKAGLAPGQPKPPAAQTRLEDRFGALVADVKSVQSVCNPTETAPHPAVHGVGYKIVGAKAPPQPPFVKTPVTTVDQLGSHRLVLVKPVDLLAPSALALGADGVAPGDPTGVDHFQCCKAARQKGAPKFVAPATWRSFRAAATRPRGWKVSVLDLTGTQDAEHYVDVALDRADVMSGQRVTLTIVPRKRPPEGRSVMGLVSSAGRSEYLWLLVVSYGGN